MIKKPITKESYAAASLNHTKRLKKRSMDNIRNDLTHLKNQQKWQKEKKGQDS